LPVTTNLLVIAGLTVVVRVTGGMLPSAEAIVTDSSPAVTSVTPNTWVPLSCAGLNVYGAGRVAFASELENVIVPAKASATLPNWSLAVTRNDAESPAVIDAGSGVTKNCVAGPAMTTVLADPGLTPG